MFEIREMNLDDFKSIENCLIAEFDNFWTPSILKSELESKLSYYIVAVIDGTIVGFAGILITPDDTEITNIVVKKTERKKGIASMLLDRLICKTKELEKNVISLEVNENNFSAIKLYEKFEFKEVGKRKNYYDGINDAIIMSKSL